MKKEDVIEVAKNLIDRSTYGVFDDNILSHIECSYCQCDVYEGHHEDCVVLKAQNIIKEYKNKE